MTQEEKQLLLKDLCARLPYHPRINVCNDYWEGCQIGEFDTNLYSHHIDAFVCDRIEVEPYLRPMSSMTEEEEDEYQECGNKDIAEAYIHLVPNNRMDWLNAHHFDYRGLIERGLALKAPDGMYKTE